MRRGAFGVDSKGNFLVLGRDQAVGVEIGLDVGGIFSSPSLWKMHIVVGEEAVVDSSKFLPFGPTPRGAAQRIELDKCTSGGVAGHGEEEEMTQGREDVGQA